MIKERNLAVCIILCIFTFGIYGIYWFIYIVNEVNLVSDRRNEMGGGMVFLLSVITCSIYSWFWFYKSGEKLEYAQQKRGMPSTNNGVLYLLLAVFSFGIVNYFLVQYELNKVASIPA